MQIINKKKMVNKKNSIFFFKINTLVARYVYDNNQLYKLLRDIEVILGEEFVKKTYVRKYIVSRLTNAWRRYRRLLK